MAQMHDDPLHPTFSLPITKIQNYSLKQCINISDPLSLGSGYSRRVHYAIISLFAMAIVISVILNSAICHVYREGAVRKTPFNALLVNLAVSDILTCVGMIPFIAVSPIHLRGFSQKTADILCTLTVGQFIFWIGDAASIMTLCVISVNRYIMINHPLTYWERLIRRNRSTAVMISIPWILAITLPLPNIISREFGWCSTKCLRVWPAWINGPAYAIAVTILGYVMPIGIMFYTLIASIHTLWFKPIPAGADILVLKYRKRVIVLLCTLVGTFFIWWTPFAAYWILSTLTQFFPEGDAGFYKRSQAIYIVTLAALLNASANPIIYGLKSDDFRQAIKKKLSVFGFRSGSMKLYEPLIDDCDPLG